MTGFACVLILAQPDMGTAMVLGFITLALLFVSGVRLGPVMKVMAALAGLALIVAVASPYRRARLLSFMDPSAHSSGSGYQVMQLLIGLGSGHIYGAGLGGGRAVGLPARTRTQPTSSSRSSVRSSASPAPSWCWRSSEDRPAARHPGGDAVSPTASGLSWHWAGGLGGRRGT